MEDKLNFKEVMLYNWHIKKWVLLNPHLNLFEDDDYWYYRCDYQLDDILEKIYSK